MDEKGKHTQGVREDESREHERLGDDMTWESRELTGICVRGICSTVYKMHCLHQRVQHLGPSSPQLASANHEKLW